MTTLTQEEQEKLLKDAQEMMIEGLLQVRKYVLALREGSTGSLPWHMGYGICHAACICIGKPEALDAILPMLQDTFEKCPSFSGDRMYPVNHPDTNPRDAFNSSFSSEMWLGGTYADNRLQLLEEAIDLLTEEVSKEDHTDEEKVNDEEV